MKTPIKQHFHNHLKGFMASWKDEDGTYIEQMIPGESLPKQDIRKWRNYA